MKPRRLVLGFVLLAAATVAVGAEHGQLVRITDTPPLSRVLIEPLAPTSAKNKAFRGTATLYLEDGTALPMTARRKLRKKKRRLYWKFTLKTPRRAKPKVKISFESDSEFGVISKIRATMKGGSGPKVSLRDAARVSIDQSVPRDVLALHDQNLRQAGLACQAPACHPGQMERYAPFKDASGKRVENFHYMKAAALRDRIFDGRSPKKFQDADCTYCHTRIRLPAASGANVGGTQLSLRRMVDVETCTGCHGPGDVGPELYLK